MASAGAEAPAAASTAKRSPSEFLKSVVGRPVVVKLTSGVEYKGEPKLPSSLTPWAASRIAPARVAGILVCLDGFMNVALEQTEEWVD